MPISHFYTNILTANIFCLFLTPKKNYKMQLVNIATDCKGKKNIKRNKYIFLYKYIFFGVKHHI